MQCLRSSGSLHHSLSVLLTKCVREGRLVVVVQEIVGVRLSTESEVYRQLDQLRSLQIAEGSGK